MLPFAFIYRCSLCVYLHREFGGIFEVTALLLLLFFIRPLYNLFFSGFTCIHSFSSPHLITLSFTVSKTTIPFPSNIPKCLSLLDFSASPEQVSIIQLVWLNDSHVYGSSSSVNRNNIGSLPSSGVHRQGGLSVLHVWENL